MMGCRDAWDTGVVSNIDGETVRFFHTRDKGVDRVWVDHECFLAKVIPHAWAFEVLQF